MYIYICAYAVYKHERMLTYASDAIMRQASSARHSMQAQTRADAEVC